MRGRSSAGSIRERRRRAGSDVPTSACTPSSSATSASYDCGNTSGTPPSHRQTVRSVRMRRSSTRIRNRQLTTRRRSVPEAKYPQLARDYDEDPGEGQPQLDVPEDCGVAGEAMLDVAAHRRVPADIGRFIVRIGPPDFPPGDAHGERRPQRDAGREVRARLGMALAERRREVQRSGVVAPTETEGNPPARGPRLIPRVDM